MTEISAKHRKTFNPIISELSVKACDMSVIFPFDLLYVKREVSGVSPSSKKRQISIDRGKVFSFRSFWFRR
jgi:hypothetical protein